ncbi:MAG TPA: hypothetical protein VGV37_05145 [Aliidongia sp.]|nr:hypothetical protein [Aliidongia sp.]
MALLRVAGLLVGLAFLAGCMDSQQMQSLKLSGPCAPNYVSLALQF